MMPTLLSSSPAIDKESCAEDWHQKFGAEPSQNYTFLGVDFKPILPVALATSTVTGAICMFLVQIPMVSSFTSLSQEALLAGFAGIYLVTLTCMGYCCFADPGQIKETHNMTDADIEAGLPHRARQSSRYPRPIRRYDHYSDWLQNVIGLLNHREFVMMVGGLVLIAEACILVDLPLLVLAKKGLMSQIIVILHLAYSITLISIFGPILRMHFGLVSRNEMAHDLEDETKEFHRDASKYVRSRNPFDNGCIMNCCNFWCQPRWFAQAEGDF